MSNLLRETPGETYSPDHILSFQESQNVTQYEAVLFGMYFRYVDVVLTIPKGTLFPMCGMNLAFDRDLIGPAMYFGLMGDGQPIGRYDDMWAGWCTKVHKQTSPARFIFCLKD